VERKLSNIIYSIFVLFIFCTILPATAGNYGKGGKFDLESDLSAMPNEQKLEVLDSLFKYYINTNVNTALIVQKIEMRLACEMGTPESRAQAFMHKASVFIETDKQDSAFYWYRKAHEISVDNNLKNYEIHCLRKMAFLRSLCGDLKGYVLAMDTIMQMNSEISDTIMMIDNLTNAGLANKRIGDYDRAFKYYSEAIELSELKNNYNKDLLYSNLGALYGVKQEYDKAAESFRRSINVSSPDRINLLGRNYCNLANCYMLKENEDSLLYYFGLAEELFKKNKHIRGESFVYSGMGSYYIDKEDYENALNYVKKSLAISKEVGDLKKIISDLNLIQEIYSKQDNKEQAYKTLLELNILEDSLKIEQQKWEVERIKLMKQINSMNKSETNDASVFPVSYKTRAVIYITVVIILIIALSVLAGKKRINLRQKAIFIQNRSQGIIGSSVTVAINDVPEKEKENDEQSLSPETFNKISNALESWIKEEKYLNIVTRHDLARDIETNPTYLSQVIRQNYKKDFSSWLNGLRVDYIILKLKEEPKLMNFTIEHISRYIGYKSPKTFSKVFKEATGISPSEYIRKIKSGTDLS